MNGIVSTWLPCGVGRLEFAAGTAERPMLELKTVFGAPAAGGRWRNGDRTARRAASSGEGRSGAPGRSVEPIRGAGALLRVAVWAGRFAAGRFLPAILGLAAGNPPRSTLPNAGPPRNEFGQCSRFANVSSSSIPFSMNGWTTRSAEIGRPPVPPPVGGAIRFPGERPNGSRPASPCFSSR
jgi:hypothetical protein